MYKAGIGRSILIEISGVLFAVVIVLWTIKKFLTENFDGLSFAEIIFHMKVPMEGTSTDMISQYFSENAVVLIILAIFVVLINVVIIKVKTLLLNRLTYITAFICSLAVFIGVGFNCVNEIGLITYLQNQFESSKFIEENYVKPDKVNLAFPEKKRRRLQMIIMYGGDLKTENFKVMPKRK